MHIEDTRRNLVHSDHGINDWASSSTHLMTQSRAPLNSAGVYKRLVIVQSRLSFSDEMCSTGPQPFVDLRGVPVNS